MPRALPPLAQLQVFEVAGRLESFKDAAAELFVTPSAVSRQIQSLEDALGFPLFQRLRPGVRLTPEGREYLAAVQDALARLEGATGRLVAGATTRPLRISVLQSFAGNWLVPRLPRFEATHPGIDVELEATTAYADFARDDVDLAIRFGRGPWEGLDSVPLLSLAFYPVTSPALRDGPPPIRTPADLAHHTLLHETHVPYAWPTWLRAAGVPDLRPARELRYDNAQLLLDAAAAGLGVALTADLLGEPLLAQGRLVRLLGDVSASSPETYHLVWRPADRERPPVRAFREWVLEEMRRFLGREPD